MLSVSTMASAQSLPASFAVGYNEAWFENYGNWLASNPLFSEPSAFCIPLTSCSGGILVSNMFSGMEAGNAKIVRIWLFPALQGICVNTSLPASCPNGATQGLTNEFLTNLTAVFSLVRTYNNNLPKTVPPLKLYITALNANDATLSPTMYPALHTYYQNLFSNSNNYNSAATQTYENSALGPILGLMSQYQDVIYGFDLINEIEAAINAGYFGYSSKAWTNARAWINNMTAFVKSYKYPRPTVVTGPRTVGQWLPVTSSAGLGNAIPEVAAGHFSNLGLNFYDVHIYSDSGMNWVPSRFCSQINLPIVLGEYGQKSSTVNDNLQNTVTTNFLKGAKSSCFSAALAWKYEALYTGSPSLSYLYITGSGNTSSLLNTCTSPLPGPYPPSTYTCPRPAYYTIQTFQ
jgi:hypothetical protein